MILEVKGLEKTYKKNSTSINEVKALKGISFNVTKGEFVGIMGSSGSGKSTLLKLIGGICKPSGGSIIINNKKMDLIKDEELALFRRKKLGFVFQDFNMIDGLNLMENILLPMILEKKNERDMNTKVKEIMEYLGIYELKEKYDYEVSGGQLQRAAISRALINEPDLILADEPTGSLDSKNSYDVMQCFTKCVNEKKATILMVTHDPFVASFCNRIIFINDGEKVDEIINTGNRKQFIDFILQKLKYLGGEENDL